MLTTAFRVNSITYAMRGKSVLEKNGIRVRIERSTDQTRQKGCGYSLIVWGQADLAKRLLIKNNIPIRGIDGPDAL